CSALHRPRWCPARLAVAPAGLQPSTRSTVSAFPWLHQGLSVRPQLYTFRGSIPQPVVSLPPAPYSPHGACTRGLLLSCWLGVAQVGLESDDSHPLGNDDLFHEFILHSLGLGLRLARGPPC